MAIDAEFVRDQLRISCVDSLELMTEYLDSALSGADRDRFRAHLDGCEACGVYLDQLRLTVQITATLGAEDTYQVDQSTMDRLVDLYRDARNNTGDL